MQDVSFGNGISTQLIRDFTDKRRAFDEAEAALEKAEKEYRETEAVLFDAMIESSTSSIRIDGLGTCTRTIKGPYASLDDNDPKASEKFETWCRETGIYSDVFRFAPQMAKVNTIVKEMRKEGEPLPPGIKVLEHKRIQVLKRKAT